MNAVNKIDGGNGRVFSYSRWSSDGQTAGDSERRQTQMALDWCKANGRTLCQQRYIDSGVSGWRGDNRKSGALGALLKVVKAGDKILVEDADRWSRESPLDSLSALRDTVNRGVEIVFLKSRVTVTSDNFNDPAVLIPNFFSAFLANSENNKRANRIREIMSQRRALVDSGKAVKGQMPCWLRWDDTQGKPVVIEEKAQTVRRIFELSLSGMGFHSIVRALAGTPCISRSKASRWNTRFVHRLLTDKSVLGFHCREGESPVPGVYPAIVDETTFFRCREKSKARKTYTVALDCRNSSLFTGICKCAACGGSLIRIRTGHAPNYYAYLACANGVRREKKPCTVRAKAVRYELFEQSFLNFIADGDLVRQALGSDKKPAVLDALKAKLAAVQEKANGLLLALADDDKPAKRVLDLIKALEQQESELQAQVDAESAKAKTETPTALAYETLCAMIKDGKIDRSQLRDAIADVVERVEMNLHKQNGVWSYTVHLKNSVDPVLVEFGKHGQINRSLRPAELAKPGENIIG